MNKKLLRLFFLFLAFSFVGCEADIDLNNLSKEINARPSLLMPLGGIDFNFGELISVNDTTGRYVVEDGDGYEIYYQKFDSSEYKFREINLLAEQKSLIKDFTVPGLGISVIPANTTILSESSTEYLNLGLNLEPDNVRIDSVYVKRAVLSVVVNQNDLDLLPSNLQAKIILPATHFRLLNSNASNVINISPVAFGVPVKVELSDFIFYTVGSANGVSLDVDIQAKTGTSPSVVSSASGVQIQIGFDEMEYAVAYGYFEPAIIATRRLTQPIDLYEDFPDGNLKLANPQVSITAVSNIGTYHRFQIDNVNAYSTSDTSATRVYASFNGSPSTYEIINKPAAPGETITKQMKTLDKTWGETYRLFQSANRPDMLEYNFTSTLDKESINNDKTPNFITPDATTKVYIKTIIPFDLNPGSYYEYKDTIYNVFTSLESLLDRIPQTQMDSVYLVLDITNGLPVKANLNIKPIDFNGNEMETDFVKDYVIQSGKTDADGIVQTGQESSQVLNILATREQMKTLLHTNSIVATVRILGEDLTSKIHFTKYNKLKINAGFFIQGKSN